MIDENIPTNHPAKIALATGLSPAQARAQMYEIFMRQRLSYMISLFPDRLNWKSFEMNAANLPLLSTTPKESELRLLASVPADVSGWVKRMPDSAILVLKTGSEITQMYTIIRNKDMKTVGSLLFEDHMRQTQNDTLTILEGLATSYPNYFFVVPIEQYHLFIQGLLKADDDVAWNTVKYKWGLSRTNEFFWKESDLIQDYVRRKFGVNSGVLDYTHYDVWTD